MDSRQFFYNFDQVLDRALFLHTAAIINLFRQIRDQLREFVDAAWPSGWSAGLASSSLAPIAS